MEKNKMAIIFLLLLAFSYVFPLISYANLGSVRYQVHLKDYGWIETAYDGNTAGTVGECRRMEAISIATSNVDGKLEYQVHVQDYGWLPRTSEGIISGTTGQEKRMEAIVIYLDNSSYNIKYRVHIQDYGWLDWVESGQVAGTTGQSRRIEAIQIIVKKKQQNDLAQDEITSTEEVNSVKLGIDVSKHQGYIDWQKVKESGIQFAIIRCGYRGYTEGNIYEDQYFYRNVVGAHRNGIDVGLYFYSSAINEYEAKEEANFVLGLINDYRLEKYISYPIVIDIEDIDGSRSNDISIQDRTNLVKEFCYVIKNNDYIPMIYSYTYFLENKLYMDQLNQFDTWIADYYGNTWYGRKYRIWQFTDKGEIDGINGFVDLNFEYY